MSRSPDFVIGALDKARDVRQPRVGAAWLNSDGTITVNIDPFVTLTGGPDLLVTLFPNKNKNEGAVTGRTSNKSPNFDEIPF